jgi:hypothetical protein
MIRSAEQALIRGQPSQRTWTAEAEDVVIFAIWEAISK